MCIYIYTHVYIQINIYMYIYIYTHEILIKETTPRTLGRNSKT